MAGCKTCPSCGKGVPSSKSLSATGAILCQVFCEARNEVCELKRLGKPAPKPSDLAASKMRKPAIQGRLSKALAASGRYPKGVSALPERTTHVLWKGDVPKSWHKRTPVVGKRLEALLKPMREEIERKIKATAAQVMKKKLAKKAATVWLKAIPVVNVISTAYDVYDLATTGYDLYKMVNAELAKVKGTIFEIRPDVSIVGSDGKLHETFDFKFDTPSFENGAIKWKTTDTLAGNHGQAELYKEASGRPVNVVDQDTCKCK